MKLTLAGLLFCSAVWAQASPEMLSFLPQADQDTLLKEGSLKVFSDRFEHLRLWKGSPFQSAVQSQFANRESTLAVEALFAVPVSLPADMAAREKALERAMTAVSTMKGLQVYSISLKRMETFIFDAYRTQSNDKKTRLDDPEIPLPSAATTFVMFQNEEQTGESFSRYSFLKEAGWYKATLTNLTSLNYGFIPLVAPEGLLTAVYVVPQEDRLVIYGVSVAKTIGLFGLERSKTSSLYTRMEALVNWLTNNLKTSS